MFLWSTSLYSFYLPVSDLFIWGCWLSKKNSKLTNYIQIAIGWVSVMASAVGSSRFKMLPVTKRVTIKAFVETNKLSFKKGRGFYQLNKPELIQDYKEMIIRKKDDGSLITGEAVREELGVPKSSKKFKIDLDELPDFDVFVQSTSVNRMLLPDTDFLYEAEEEVRSGGSSYPTAIFELNIPSLSVLSQNHKIIKQNQSYGHLEQAQTFAKFQRKYVHVRKLDLYNFNRSTLSTVLCS